MQARIPNPRVGPPRPPECNRATPPRPLPRVGYKRHPRPLPISGTFPADQMNAMIAQLPDPRHREIITMRYLHGYQWVDIASAMAYDRTSIWRMHKAAIAQINQMVQRKISAEAPPTTERRLITGKGWAGLAFTTGAVLVAAAWWIIDTAILTSPAGPGTAHLIDLDSLRPWALALWIGSNVTGWCARISYERMPVTGREVPHE